LSHVIARAEPEAISSKHQTGDCFAAKVHERRLAMTYNQDMQKSILIIILILAAGLIPISIYFIEYPHKDINTAGTCLCPNNKPKP
jgi:hypothetical protein